MDGKRKLRIAHRNRLFRAGACQQSRHDADGRELRRNRAQGYAHQDRARTLGNGYQAGACQHDAHLSQPITRPHEQRPSRSSEDRNAHEHLPAQRTRTTHRHDGDSHQRGAVR